jgi:hypothetical protein
LDFYQVTVEKQRLCPDATGGNPRARVSALLVRGGLPIAWAANGHGSARLDADLKDVGFIAAAGSEHAEQLVLDRVQGENLGDC